MMELGRFDRRATAIVNVQDILFECSMEDQIALVNLMCEANEDLGFGEEIVRNIFKTLRLCFNEGMYDGEYGTFDSLVNYLTKEAE